MCECKKREEEEERERGEEGVECSRARNGNGDIRGAVLARPVGLRLFISWHTFLPMQIFY